MNRSCDNCAFSVREYPIADELGGPPKSIECHRYAPKPRTDGGITYAKWPLVQAEDFCGEWVWEES